jgi:iron(II)-dependent oxidoreductase
LGYLPKQGWRVDLASEPEWEKAAKGGLKILQTAVVVSITDDIIKKSQVTFQFKKNDFPQRHYPWEGDINYDMTIGTVSALGCYPLGKSPYGCEEMAGNVFEWTRSAYEETYPEDSSEWLQRNSRENTEARVLRGGAFHDLQYNVRCAARFGYGPDLYNNDIGLRLVLSPLPLDDESLSFETLEK